MLKYFGGSFIFSVLALACAFWLGGWAAAWTVAVLGVLEVSLSFDNAVVNATVLKNWGAVWRKRFILWGMPIAVIGMRIVFPLLIVGMTAKLGPLEALMLAKNSPAQYQEILTAAHLQITGFGGAFLMMVFLKFFLDDSKDEHWLSWLEHPLTKLARFTEVLVLALLVAITLALNGADQAKFLVAGVCGLATFLLVQVLAAVMGGDGDEEKGQGSSRVIKEGIGGFLYLEMLDSSFSFDGVIGAFALSNNIFIIALGLGIGAMFVRSMTVMLVEKGTLAQFRYLEHGAYWAIGALATIMFIGIGHEVPEAITGLVGAAAIGTALWSSIRANRIDAAAVAA